MQGMVKGGEETRREKGEDELAIRLTHTSMPSRRRLRGGRVCEIAFDEEEKSGHFCHSMALGTSYEGRREAGGSHVKQQ